MKKRTVFTLWESNANKMWYVRKYLCRALGLSLMNSAFYLERFKQSLDPENSVITVLANYASNPESPNQTDISHDSISGLLIQSLSSEKLNQLKIYRSQLVSTEPLSPEKLRLLTKALKLVVEIIEEDWDVLPESIQKELQNKLELFNLKITPAKIIVFFKFFIIGLINFFQTKKEDRNKVVEKAGDEFLELSLKMQSLSLEIKKYGYPLKYRDSAQRKASQQVSDADDIEIKNEIHAETLQWLESLPVTNDRWLDSCPEEKSSFEKGLAQAKSGRVVRRSFVDMEFDD